MNTDAGCSSERSVGVRMTRAGFLRAAGLGAAWLAGAVAGLGSRAQAMSRAEAADVYPTGVYPRDVLEVTAAVNGGTGPSGRTYPGGGTVRLRARSFAGTPAFFNFGDSAATRSSVAVTRDVVIVGEPAAPLDLDFPNPAYPEPPGDFEPDRTVIYGGRRVFACPADSPAPVRLTVRGLYFAYPSLAAVQVAKSAGLEVSDCVVYKVEWDLTGASPPLPAKAAVGIEATGGLQPTPELTGDFRVVNNRIVRATPTTAPTNFGPADAGIVLQRARMNALISANEVSAFAFQGIGIDRNEGPATVTANAVSSCGYGLSDTSGGIGVRGTTTPVAIERNTIECGPCAPGLPSKNGIAVASAGVLVRGNRIVGTVRLDGIQLTAFSAGGTTFTASDGRFSRNSLTGLTAGRSQVLVKASCNANQFTNDDYGAVAAASGLAGIVVQGNDNALVNEHFRAVYPGVAGTPSLPCVWLQAGSYGNSVTALKYQDAPSGKDLCSQIRDDGANLIPGYERCLRP